VISPNWASHRERRFDDGGHRKRNHEITVFDGTPSVFAFGSRLGRGIGDTAAFTFQVSEPAQSVVIALMFLGRLGPLVFGVAILGCGQRVNEGEALRMEDVSL